MPSRLTTHVLDTADGCPAEGMQIELWSVDEPQRRLLKTVQTNAEGRTDLPLLGGEELRTGQYELVFFVGDYFARHPAERFLDRVPVRVRLVAGESYHVPLLCSPWSYATYRGS
ncbi:MAG TPA: hydroxyisourate hydrolase [Verrucomicrobiae bacterium]|nr:hydroxyisourate hydrolase [Verrucomicrobiae bacterium]